jgi:hypothetical protein
MKKLMLAAMAAMSLAAFAGCDQESGTKKETVTKTDTPGGEVKTTEKTEVKTEKSGDAKDTATSPAI